MTYQDYLDRINIQEVLLHGLLEEADGAHLLEHFHRGLFIGQRSGVGGVGDLDGGNAGIGHIGVRGGADVRQQRSRRVCRGFLGRSGFLSSCHDSPFFQKI